jgi:predicted dehydrogenase/nucleoside-diphosphate-sugar epimerase
MADEARFRVGLVGAGYIAPYHLAALRRVPSVRVVGLTDLNAERARETALRNGVDGVFPSLRAMVDAGASVVHVLTPPDSHAEIALRAMELGCDVYVEKPLATSVEDCDRLIEAAARLGRRAGVGHSLLGDEGVSRALALARAGRLGDVLGMDVFYASEYPPYRGGEIPVPFRDGGYPFRDLGVHALYLVRAFLGEIRSIDAQFEGRGAEPLLEYDDWRLLVACERGGATIRLSWSARPLQHYFVVHGTRGSLRTDLAYLYRTGRFVRQLPGVATRVVNALGEGFAPLWQVPKNVTRFLFGGIRPYQQLHDFVREFYEALAWRHDLPATLEDGRAVVRWTEEVARCADVAKRRARSAPGPLKPGAVLVTGGGGFVGRRLVVRLLTDGARVRLLLRREAPPGISVDPRVEIVRGDLGDPAAVRTAVEGVSVVFHLGAATGGDWEDHERSTVRGTENVVRFCLEFRIPRLVHVSSLSVLRWAEHTPGARLDETAPLEPRPTDRGFYSQAKLEAERIVRAAAHDRGLPAVIIRPGQIFGPGASAVAGAGGIALGRRLVLLGDGTAMLPLVYVDDLVDALMLALERGRADGSVYHIVDHPNVRQVDLARRAAARERLRVVRLWQPLAVAAGFAGEIAGRLLRRRMPVTRYKLRSLQADIRFDGGKARTELGWTPGVGLERGLEWTLGSQGVES